MSDPTFRIDVCYPSPDGAALRLRTELDWDRDLEPIEVADGGTRARFEVRSTQPFLYFKPVLHEAHGLRWAQGENCLAAAPAPHVEMTHPFFAQDSACSHCEVHDVAGGEGYRVRVLLPAGYHENTLTRHPVLILQDGQNAFLPDDAYLGQHWHLPETLRDLDAMNLVRGTIVVGVYPGDRHRDYTRPGYETYGAFLARVLKPWLDARYRTRQGPEHTAVMGSSLGGVASLHAGLAHSDVFGKVACLSSTFGFQDDLRDRVAHDGRRPVHIYLDSGWPRDNYEVTRAMRDTLARAGWEEGRDLHYFAFPNARHDERAWATRAHLPLQLLLRRSA